MEALFEASRARAGTALGLALLVAAIVGTGIILTPYHALLSWAVELALMVAFIAAAARITTGRAVGALIDERNKISLSRFQMVVWTTVILSAYLTAALYNIGAGATSPLAIAVPEQLWIVMGISTTSLIGSPLVKGEKRRRNPEKRLRTDSQESSGLIVENRDPRDASWGDLFSGEEIKNRSTLDLSKIQMFFFTLVLVIAYAGAIGKMFHTAKPPIAELPSLHESMLALLGISHAGYLTHKALPLSPEATARTAERPAPGEE
jgi:hypothetical protein